MRKLLLFLCLCVAAAAAATNAVTIHFDASTITASENDSRTESVISAPGLSRSLETGAASIPVEYIRFSVPYDAVDISVQASGVADHTLRFAYPLAININEYEPEFRAEKLYPTDLAEVVNVSFVEGENKVVTVALYPVQVKGDERSATVYSSITSTLSWSKSSDITKEDLQPIVPRYATGTFDTSGLINPEDVEANRPPRLMRAYDGERDDIHQYIIVAPQRLVSELERLVSYRRLKGYTCEIFSIESILSDPRYAKGDEISGLTDDAGKLRAFLLRQYKYFGTKHVLLAGKYPEMPIRYVGKASSNYNRSAYPTDLYFGDMNGSWKYHESGMSRIKDHSCELNVGRIPFETENEVTGFVDKLILYETNPGRGNVSYLNNFFLARQNYGMMDWPGHIGYFKDNNLTSYFKAIKQLNVIDYTETGASFPKGNDIIDKLNQTPCGIHDFIGHGNPSAITINGHSINGQPYGILALKEDNWYNHKESHNGLDMLNHADYPAWSFNISCTLMPFDLFMDGTIYSVRKTFGDSYLLNPHGGGVVFMGNTRPAGCTFGEKALNYFYPHLVDCYQQSHTNYEKGVTAGQMMSEYKAYSEDSEPFIHNLLGDPLTNLWFGAPAVLKCEEWYKGSEDAYIYSFSGTDCGDLLMSEMPLNWPESVSCFPVDEAYLSNLEPKNNVVRTVFGKNALPITLKTYIQDYRFAPDAISITGHDILCGRLVNQATSEGEVYFSANSQIKLYALGSVLLNWGCVFESNSELTIQAAEKVELSNITIPADAKLKITAPQIIINRNVVFENDANVELNGEVRYTNVMALKSRKASVDRPRMVEKGKTWWYRKEQVYYRNVFNYGVSIGDEVELDGEVWNEVNVVLCGLTDKNGETRFDKTPQTVAYIREADGKIMSRVKYIEEYAGLLAEVYIISDIYGYWFDYSEEHENFCLMDWSAIDSDNTIILGNYKYQAGLWGHYRQNGTETIQNSGKEYTLYNLSCVDEQGSSLREDMVFYEGLGLNIYWNHFFLPYVPVYTRGPENYTWPRLTYITDPEGEVIYEELGGEKLWEMAGVDLPTADGHEPVRWYNLQGLEISEPHSAGIYIRRQGLEVQKVMVE